MKNYSIIKLTNDFLIINDVSDYLCVDNKIHLRFKDFNKEQYVVGFEKKLDYLLSYLMNFYYLPTVIGNYSVEKILDNFLQTADMRKIIDCLNNQTLMLKFKGIKLKAHYARDKQNYKAYGDINDIYFPLITSNGVVQTGNLNIFLDIFDITLYTYLFDDNYIIWLHDKKFKTAEKFKNKKIRKNKNIDADKLISLVSLW